MVQSIRETAPSNVPEPSAGSADTVARGGDQGMTDCRILVVGAEAARLESVLGDSKEAVLSMETASAAADWLWEKGEEVRVVALDRSLFEQPEVQEFLSLCERDWPALKIVWV